MKKKTTITLEDTGERMVPEFHKGRPVWGLVYAEHVTRYLCAQQLSQGKRVLDIACGSGYGTRILADNAAKVYGVDIDAATIKYASKNYGAKNIEYIVGDGAKIPLADDAVDVVVSFETIEHIEDYKQFLTEVKRVLTDDGILILSTPNDLEFAEGNHFHVHEFEYDELQAVVKKYFKNVDSYFQSTWKAVAVGPDKMMGYEGSIESSVLNLAPLKPEQYLYFYLVCSNQPINQKIKPLTALGSHYSDRDILGAEAKLKQEIEQLKQDSARLVSELHAIRNSKRYKLAGRLAAVKNLGRK